MTKPTDHDLKTNFLRQLQAPPVKPAEPAQEVRNRRPKCHEALSLSVHPLKVEEARALTKAHGLSGIGFNNDGTCVVSDDKHKAKYARLVGLADHTGANTHHKSRD
jgi:hypothetical protein